MEIVFKEKQPIPSIINVKQYESNVTKIVFKVKKVFSGDKKVYITSENFKTELSFIENETEIVAEWNIAETRKKGSFDIQLSIENDEKIWKSYKFAFVVSESVGGQPEPPIPEKSGIVDGIPIFTLLMCKAIKGTGVIIDEVS